MIILLVILSALSFYLFGAVWVEKASHLLWAGMSLIILVASVTVFALHDVNHLGMKTVTTTQTVSLASVNPQANLLVYKQLGTGNEKVYVYKTDIHQKKTKHTWIDSKATTKLTQTTGDAKVVIKTQKYVYANGFAKAMFGILGDNNETRHRSYDFQVNPTWAVINTHQAAQLTKQLKQPAAQAQMKTVIASQVKQRMAQALQQNPHLTPAQQGALQLQFMNEAKAQAIQQLVK